MPYGELPPLTETEYNGLRSGALTPNELFVEAERRDKTHAFFERLMTESPREWQAMFDQNAEAWSARMRADNGRVTSYNPSGKKFKRKQLKLMAQQWAFDSLGVNYSEHAATADELLERAEAMSRLGATFKHHGLT
jgi:hypothetical protein